MTPREIVRRSVHFQTPERKAYYCSRFGMNDTVNVFDFFRKDKDGFDPWGIQWDIADDENVATIGIPKTPPLEDESEIWKIKIPDPKLFAGMVKENISKLGREDKDKYRIVYTSSGIWERVQYFRGMERIMCDMIENPALVHRLLGMCTDFWVSFIKELSSLRGEIDAIYMFEDWGTQNDSMISPELWREFFGPQYRRITGAAHDNKMDFWLHSCGKVTKLINEFIDVKMDLLNPYQSGTCGYEEVASRFAGKVAFLTTVDTQTTLPHASKEQILSECARLAKWDTEKGGLIIATYGFDIPEENERIVFDYFHGKEQKHRDNQEK